METDSAGYGSGGTADHTSGQWERFQGRLFGDFTAHASDSQPFFGKIESANVGGIEIARISSNVEKLSRSHKQINSSGGDYYFLVAQVSGMSRMRQNDREANLSPGSLTLIDYSRPSEFEYDGPFLQYSVHFPKKTLENCFKSRNLSCAEARGTGTAAIACDLIHSIFLRSKSIPQTSQGIVRDSLLDIVYAAFDQRADAGLDPNLPPIKVTQIFHLMNFIESRISDPALSPGKIAEEYGISTRHLHRIFGWAGWSYREWLRSARLDKCQTDLSDPKFAGHSITQIAFSWGFNDASHFSRAFRQKFGVTAREFRQKSQVKRAMS